MIDWRDARKLKTIEKDTGWKTGAIPPRHAPVYVKSKRLPPVWQWRAIHLKASEGRAICLLQVSPTFGKWQAFLFVEVNQDVWTTLARLEDQPRQSGLHAHGACDGQEVTGPPSINLPDRVPPHRSYHRRQTSWTEETFYRAACNFYNIMPTEQQRDMFYDT